MNPTLRKGSEPVPSRRILVVEDDAEISRLCLTVLQRQGYRVDTAVDGETGWNCLTGTSHGPDPYTLLITDNEMPRLTGVALVEKVRSAQINLPVIMMSGTMPEDVQSLRLAGALWKPFLPTQLLDAVLEALGMRHPSAHSVVAVSRDSLRAT